MNWRTQTPQRNYSNWLSVSCRIARSYDRNGVKVRRQHSKDCPKGSNSGPLLWNIVNNTALRMQLGNDVYFEAYADDFGKEAIPTHRSGQNWVATTEAHSMQKPVLLANDDRLPHCNKCGATSSGYIPPLEYKMDFDSDWFKVNRGYEININEATYSEKRYGNICKIWSENVYFKLTKGNRLEIAVSGWWRVIHRQRMQSVT